MESFFSEDHTLAWILFLLYGAEKAGLAPVDSKQVQQLQFLGNTLADVYGTAPPIYVVQKLARGPYYPDVDRDLDLLVVRGLGSMRNLAWHASQDGCWKTAEYSLTPEGFSLAQEFLRDLEWCRQISVFLSDLCLAFANVDEAHIDSAPLADLTYNRAGNAEGEVIRFSARADNTAARAARAFDGFFSVGLEPNRQQRINLYMKFLEKRSA